MTLAIAILGIIGTALAFVVKLYWKRQEPKQQLELKLDENDKAISRGDVNALLDQRLRDVRPKSSNHSRQ